MKALKQPTFFIISCVDEKDIDKCVWDLNMFFIFLFNKTHSNDFDVGSKKARLKNIFPSLLIPDFVFITLLLRLRLLKKALIFKIYITTFCLKIKKIITVKV